MSLRAEFDSRQILSGAKQVCIQLSFSKSGCRTKTKESRLLLFNHSYGKKRGTHANVKCFARIRLWSPTGYQIIAVYIIQLVRIHCLMGSYI